MTEIYKLNNDDKKWLIHLSEIKSIDDDDLNLTASTNNKINFNVSGNGKVSATVLDICNNLRIYGNSFFNKSLQIDNSSVKIPNTFNNFAVKYAYELNSVHTKIANEWIDCSNDYKLNYTPLTNKSKILIHGKISYLANLQYNQLISFKLSRIINNGQPQDFYDLSFGTSVGAIYNGIYTFNYIDSPDTSYNITYYLSYKINDDVNDSLDISHGIIGYDLSNINSFIAQELYIPSTENIIESVNRNFVNILNNNKDASFNNLTISNNLIVSNGYIIGDGSELSGVGSSVVLSYDNTNQNNIITKLGNSGSNLDNSTYDNILIGKDSGKNLSFNSNQNIIIGLSAGSEISNNINYEDNILIGNNAGKKAGYNSDACKYNICIGEYAAANAIKLKEYNIIIGKYAAYETSSNKYLKSNIIIGTEAGYKNNSDSIIPEERILIGTRAGYENADAYAICIGADAGYYSAAKNSINIGISAGFTNTHENCINIGAYCGSAGAGINSINIGSYCNYTNSNVHNNAIVINATGSDLSSVDHSTCVIKPIREKASSTQLLYNANNGELTNYDIKLLSIDSCYNSTISGDNRIYNWNINNKIDTASKWNTNEYEINTSGFWKIDFTVNLSSSSSTFKNNINIEIIRKDTNSNNISLNKAPLQINNIDSTNYSSAFVSIIADLSENDHIYPKINNLNNANLINATFAANLAI